MRMLVPLLKVGVFPVLHDIFFAYIWLKLGLYVLMCLFRVEGESS